MLWDPKPLSKWFTAHLKKSAPGTVVSTGLNEKAPANVDVYGGFIYFMYGGEIGIRTLGTGEGTTDFESVPFGHSGISPTARIITAHLLEAKPLKRIFSVLSDACVDYSGTPRRWATSS